MKRSDFKIGDYARREEGVVLLPLKQLSGGEDGENDNLDDYSRLRFRLPKWRQRSCVYRFSDFREGPELLLQVLLERNWVAHDEHIHGKNGWNLLWGSSDLVRHSDVRSTSTSAGLQPWQSMNRIPQAGIITRKDRLVRCIRCMQLGFGAIYDFIPKAFVLPKEYVRFVLEFSRLRDSARASAARSNIWICKPADQSRGRGITIFRELHQLCYSSYAIVQRYLCNPLLVSGYKFDLRLYVCIPSFRPLVAYVYHEGLVRFATEPFDLSTLRNPFAHLTNSAINKFSPAYDEGKGSVGLGCKWSLCQLRHYLARGLGRRRRNNEQQNLRAEDDCRSKAGAASDWQLWQRVAHIILLTLLGEAPLVSSNLEPTFELYGFDVIVDSNFLPWLLEVNRHPSLALDCEVDTVVKKPLLHDLLDLIGIEDSIVDNSSTAQYAVATAPSTATLRPYQTAPHGKRIALRRNTSPLIITGPTQGPKLALLRDQKRPISSSYTSGAESSFKTPTTNSRWQLRWASNPPKRMGGFVRLFPTGTRSWKGPNQTRAVVQYVRQLQQLLGRATKEANSRCPDRLPDDEDYLAAMQLLTGNDDVLFWTPRR